MHTVGNTKCMHNTFDFSRNFLVCFLGFLATTPIKENYMYNRVTTTVELAKHISVEIQGVPRTNGPTMVIKQVVDGEAPVEIEVKMTHESIRALTCALEMYR